MTAVARTLTTEGVGVTGSPSPAIVHLGYTHTDLTYELNRLAGTLDNGRSTLTATGAANVWASTTGLALVGALNSKNETTNLGLRAVCNALGNTTNRDPAYALSQIETPT